MDQQGLFPAPQDVEKTWTRAFALSGGQSVDVPLFASLIEGELRDQISLKSSVRKAALRSSQKTIQRLSKKGVAKLGDADLEELKWSLFICHVDSVLAGRHLSLREDADAVEGLAKDEAFAAA